MVTLVHTISGLSSRRRGTVLPLVVLTMMVLLGFLALAVDLSMLAIAKTQVQQAADLVALTAARSLNGNASVSYNQTEAATNAQNVLSYNVILGSSIQSSQLTLAFGSYDYSQSTQSFSPSFPPKSGSTTTAVSATVTSSSVSPAFGKLLGATVLPSVTATAQAVHRPRDIALVMDLSGSMRMGTCLGFDFYPTTRATNNPDTLVPTFGSYSSSSAVMQGPTTNRTSGSSSYTIPPSNTTAPNSSYTRTYVNNFYQNAAYASTLIRAFDSYTSSDGGNTWSPPSSGSPTLPPTSYASVPGGDVPLFLSGSTTTYAKTVKDVIGGSTSRNASWELDGYSNYTNGSLSNAASGQSNYTTAPFYGYTQGPGYYGVTFFIWPPDPREPLTTASDATAIKQFLMDFGYTAADFSSTSVTTTLPSTINSSQTTISVTSSSLFPTVPFRILVGTEIINVTAMALNSWTVQRAMDGTSGASHTSGTTVGLLTGPPLYGIYGPTTTTGSQNWPWPNDGGNGSGTTLSNYLTSQVYQPGSKNKLTTSDSRYQQIMRLYSWNYVVDDLGTTPCDWRLRFFGTDDNTKIFNTSNGTLKTPGSSNYTINYNEILRWIAQSPNPFPQQLRAGRVKYYGSIPTAITGTWPNYGSTDQRFWVEFIDYVLGFRQTAAGSYQDISAMAGYGSDFNWGTNAITSPPGSGTQYMSYTDNPDRPLLRYWFGPMAMVDYLQNYNMDNNVSNYYFMQPGDSYEAPIYTAKEAFQAAIGTMQNQHPNDLVSLIPYSWPRSSSNTTTGRFNCVACPLGNNYNYASAALFFPFSTINADGSPNSTEVTPYDPDPATGLVPSANFSDTARADGDTCFAMALMLAYNQFAVTPSSDTTLRTFVSSSPITFPTAMAGGMGRKGSQKVIIFETDGLANCQASASLVSAGTYSYYKIRYDMNNPSHSEYPSVTAGNINDSTTLNQVYSLVQSLATTYSTQRNPFRLYAVGFGPVFQGANATSALQTLQTMQYYSGTQASASTPLSSYQVITGTDAQMSANMVTAFTNILQQGVQIALIK
jgi:Flp pilus assembly protein TadG